MRKSGVLFTLFFLLFSSVIFGQKELNISSMKEGTKLTDADIGFLNMISKAKIGEGSRGAEALQATIAGVTYKTGQTLTGANATSINKAFQTFKKTYKAPEASRGLCWYWYYYCDAYGNCYYYKYYYYC